jgi:hypothetical protein
VDADIASALLLEIPNEFDQPAVDQRRILKAGVRSRIATLLDGQPTVAARRELGVAVQDLRRLYSTPTPVVPLANGPQNVGEGVGATRPWGEKWLNHALSGCIG